MSPTKVSRRNSVLPALFGLLTLSKNMTAFKFALSASVLALANWTYAAGLFLPVEEPDAPSELAAPRQNMSARLPARETWERRVYVARNELAKARDEVQYSGAARLLLNIKADVDLDVVVERTAPTSYGYSLSGRIEGGSGGFVTLVVHAQAVAASIWTPAATYEVAHLGGRVHALREVTNEPRPECAGAVYPELATTGKSAQSGVDDGSVVDVLVVWTPAREDEAGGEAQVKSQIGLAIAYTNDALERSGALVSFNVVGTERVDYEESDHADSLIAGSIDIERLSNRADGYMDSVHGLRDALGADLVSLAVAGSGRRGRGELGGPFSVATNSPFVFAHEAGHNMGLLHDRGDNLLGPRSYEHGFVAPRSSRPCWLTIMSYGNRCFARGGHLSQRVPFYSSPWRYHSVDGTALGVSRFSGEHGTDGPADAVLTLNRMRHRIANFRPSRSRSD